MTPTPSGLATRMLRLLPPRWQDRVVAARAGRPWAPPPPPVEPPETPLRLYVAPANFAGQAFEWARAVERHVPGVGARNMAVPNSFEFGVDNPVTEAAYWRSLEWSASQRRRVGTFTHVLAEAGKPLFPRLGGGFGAQLRELRAAGLAVGVVCHGSEARLPSAHAAREPWSPFRDPADPDVARLEAGAASFLAELSGLRSDGVPAFVTTPDLLADVPWATWVPLVVDADRWRTAATPLERPVPLVVHAPSKAAIKGTDLVEPVLESLAADGVIEYRRAEGLSHDEMAALYRSADVVLDQFRLGSYGVTACEAMAAGRVVVAHVDETVRAAVERRAGMPLPIVEATPATLRDVVAGIVHDRAGARERAAAGPRFVSTLHDGRAAADALRDFLLTGAHRRATP